MLWERTGGAIQDSRRRDAEGFLQWQFNSSQHSFNVISCTCQSRDMQVKTLYYMDKRMIDDGWISWSGLGKRRRVYGADHQNKITMYKLNNTVNVNNMTPWKGPGSLMCHHMTSSHHGYSEDDGPWWENQQAVRICSDLNNCSYTVCKTLVSGEPQWGLSVCLCLILHEARTARRGSSHPMVQQESERKREEEKTRQRQGRERRGEGGIEKQLLGTEVNDFANHFWITPYKLHH